MALFGGTTEMAFAREGNKIAEVGQSHGKAVVSGVMCDSVAECILARTGDETHDLASDLRNPEGVITRAADDEGKLAADAGILPREHGSLEPDKRTLKLSARTGWSSIVLAMLMASPSQAIEGGGESSFLEALPVVLSVSRVPAVRADLPGAVTILDERLIRATGYRDLGRLLRLVPGMQTGQERGNSYWVTYHGLGKDYPNQVQILVDGRSVYSPAYMDASSHTGALALAIEDIERIEVLRGSDFATYGSNGYLGLVNIITRHSRDESRANIRLTAGQRGVGDIVARASVQGEDLGMRVTAQSIGDDGFSGLSDSRRIGSVNLRADWRLGSTDWLLLTASHTSARRGMGYPDTLFNGSGLRDETTRAQHARVTWRRDIGPAESVEFSAHHGQERIVDEWTVYSKPPMVPLELAVNANNASRWTSLEVQHRFPATDDLQLAWGAEWRQDSLRAPILFYRQGTQQRDMARLYGNMVWRLDPEWLLNASVLAERVSGLPTRIAPRAFLIWQPTPGFSGRLGYTRAYHQPSIAEQKADSRLIHPSFGLLQRRLLADPSVRAQRIDVIEGGVLFSESRAGTLDVRVFHETVTGLIRRIPIDIPAENPLQAAVQAILGSSSWQNYPRRVRLSGIEYEWHSPRYGGSQFLLTHSLVHTSGGSAAIRRGVASHTASLTWLQDWNGWHSSATLFRRGRMDASTGFLPGYQYMVPAVTQLDASVWREFNIGGHHGEVRLTGLNLLRSRQEVAYNPVQRAMGSRIPNVASRSVYASMSLEF